VLTDDKETLTMQPVPPSDELTSLLHDVVAEARRLAQAANLLQATGRLLPGDPGLAGRLAALEDERRRLGDRLDRALAGAPPPDHLLKDVSQAWCAVDRPEDAMAMLGQAIAVRAGARDVERRAGARQLYAWYAEAVQLSGRVDEVEEALRQRLEAAPTDAVANCTLTALLIRGSRFAEGAAAILRGWGRGDAPFGRFGNLPLMLDRFKGMNIWEGLTIEDAVMLHCLACQAARPGAVFVEIGSWLGMSTAILGDVAASVGGTVIAIDTWAGSDGTWQEGLVASSSLFDGFCANMDGLGLLHSTVKPVQARSDTCTGLVEPGTVDLLFIDGDHRYAGVRSDIALWTPKVRPGGIVCGHDCERHYAGLSDTERAAVDAGLECDGLPGLGHPGVIKAVHEAFGGAAELAGSGSCVWWANPSQKTA
jgi:hypothetical protein